ncbi:hypothetical protein GQ457_05G019760 [Hibiscus cannabinus]
MHSSVNGFENSRMKGMGLWKKVVNGRSILFWSDVLVGSIPLKSLFPCIFDLSHNKNGKITEFGSKFEAGWI